MNLLFSKAWYDVAMLITRSGFKMFTQYDLGANLDAFVAKMCKEIESDNLVLSQDEKKYIADRMKKHLVNPLILHADKVTVTQQEAEIP